MEQFFKVIWPLVRSLEKTHFLLHNFVIGSLPVPINSLMVFTLMNYMDSVL